MKKKLTKKILGGVLAAVMILASILPMLVSTANETHADENAAKKTTNLNETVSIETEDEVKDNTSDDYVDVKFEIDDGDAITKYVKKGNHVTVKSTDANKGVLVGDAPNGSVVNEGGDNNICKDI